MKLTSKQQRFVDEYLIDLNATQAAIRAGYSPRRANCMGFENMRKPAIAAAIQAGMAKRLARTEVTQDAIIKELAKVAFYDPRSVMSWGPRGMVLKPSDQLTDDQAACVSEVSETTSATGGSLKLKTNDKLKALELLGRHLGMFTDKTELTGAGGAPLGIKVTFE